jgi:hypothetical protein
MIIPEEWGVIDENCVLIDENTMTEVDLEIVNRKVVSDLNLWIGRRYKSIYDVSPLYRVDENGNSMVREKIRLNTYFISVHGTHTLNMTKTGAGITERTETFSSTVDFPDDMYFHNLFEGEVSFYWKSFTTDAKCTFWTDHYLNCEINIISYSGQFWEYAGGL